MERTSIGGIPTFFTAHDGPAKMEIVFRTGAIDEPLSRFGSTHLIEHLAMFGWSERFDRTFAEVSLRSCTFGVRGTVQELAEFGEQLGKALAELPYDRLVDERRVLRVEANGHSQSPFEELLNARYGLNGPGKVVAPETALIGVTAEELERWRLERFTGGNVAIEIIAPELPEFNLALPAGQRNPLPDAAPLGHLELPQWTSGSEGAIAFGVEATWSPAGQLATAVLEHALTEELRTARGLIYGVHCAPEQVAVGRLNLGVAIEAMDQHLGEVAACSLEILERLATGEFDPADLERQRRDWMNTFGELEATRQSELQWATAAELYGVDWTFASFRDGIESTTVADLTDVFTSMQQSLLMLVPQSAPPPTRLRPIERPPMPEIDGQRFKERASSSSNQSVTIGSDGLSRSDDNGFVWAIGAGQIALAIEWPDGNFDVVGAEGTTLPVEVTSLKDPRAAAAALEPLIEHCKVVADDPAIAELHRLANTHLAREWTILDELRAAKWMLKGTEETPQLVAEASSGPMATGLLVLTDRRLIWLYDGLRKREAIEYPRHNISDVSLGGFGRDRIKFNYDGRKVKFGSITPRDRAAELVVALEDAG